MQQQCPASDITMCMCEVGQPGMMMMHGINENRATTFYPKAGCFRLGRNLYSLMRPDFHGCMGKHFWEMFIENPGNACRSGVFALRMFGSECSHSAYMRLGRLYMSFPVQPCFALHIWRIQRAIREFLVRRRESRRLALAMGLHPRLGCQCALMALLPLDLVMRKLLVDE